MSKGANRISAQRFALTFDIHGSCCVCGKSVVRRNHTIKGARSLSELRALVEQYRLTKTFYCKKHRRPHADHHHAHPRRAARGAPQPR